MGHSLARRIPARGANGKGSDSGESDAVCQDESWNSSEIRDRRRASGGLYRSSGVSQQWPDDCPLSVLPLCPLVAGRCPDSSVSFHSRNVEGGTPRFSEGEGLVFSNLLNSPAPDLSMVSVDVEFCSPTAGSVFFWASPVAEERGTIHDGVGTCLEGDPLAKKSSTGIRSRWVALRSRLASRTEPASLLGQLGPKEAMLLGPSGSALDEPAVTGVFSFGPGPARAATWAFYRLGIVDSRRPKSPLEPPMPLFCLEVFPWALPSLRGVPAAASLFPCGSDLGASAGNDWTSCASGGPGGGGGGRSPGAS